MTSPSSAPLEAGTVVDFTDTMSVGDAPKRLQEEAEWLRGKIVAHERYGASGIFYSIIRDRTTYYRSADEIRVPSAVELLGEIVDD